MAVDLGDTYRLSTRNLSPAGDLVTATLMVLTIRLPDDTSVIVNPVTAGSTGVYSYDYPTTQAGRHVARWLATGVGAGAHVEAFDVLPSESASLVSLGDVKDTLNIDRATTTYDDELRVYMESATSAAEDHRDEVLAKRSFTWKTWVDGRNSIVLPKRPLVSLTSIVNTQTGNTYNVSNYDVNRSTGRITARGGGSLVGWLEFTYVAGYTVVPAAYNLAVRLIIQHLWETQRGPIGASRFAGSLDDAALMRFRSMNIFVPPRAQELLGDRMPMV
jgi:hypothetical protein